MKKKFRKFFLSPKIFFHQKKKFFFGLKHVLWKSEQCSLMLNAYALTYQQHEKFHSKLQFSLLEKAEISHIKKPQASKEGRP